MSLCFLASGLSLKGTSAGLAAADAVVKLATSLTQSQSLPTEAL